MRIEFLYIASKRWLLAAVCGTVLLLAGCASQTVSNNGTTLNTVDVTQPVRLHATGTGIPREKTSILTPVDANAAKRAINNYRINIRGKESPFIYNGADLNGDGQAEIIVYLTGETWCAKTGCTLAVLTPGNHGYRTVSTIRRVKLPVRVSNESLGGWRTLIVNTGGGGMPVQSVALKFSGRGYPGNATLLAPIPQGGDVGTETIFSIGHSPAIAQSPATALTPKPQPVSKP